MHIRRRSTWIAFLSLHLETGFIGRRRWVMRCLRASWATFGYNWAPTVALNQAGHFVMYYTARDAAAGTQCIGMATARSPAGPFTDANLGSCRLRSGRRG